MFPVQGGRVAASLRGENGRNFTFLRNDIVMKTPRIAEILKSGEIDRDITVQGWVRTKRGNKNVAFIALNDGSCVANIQIVVDPTAFDEDMLKSITTGACLRVDGPTTASTTSIHRSSRGRTARVPAPCSV